jgi:hypothetical protein
MRVSSTGCIFEARAQRDRRGSTPETLHETRGPCPREIIGTSPLGSRPSGVPPKPRAANEGVARPEPKTLGLLGLAGGRIGSRPHRRAQGCIARRSQAGSGRAAAIFYIQLWRFIQNYGMYNKLGIFLWCTRLFL